VRRVPPVSSCAAPLPVPCPSSIWYHGEHFTFKYRIMTSERAFRYKQNSKRSAMEKLQVRGTDLLSMKRNKHAQAQNSAVARLWSDRAVFGVGYDTTSIPVCCSEATERNVSDAFHALASLLWLARRWDRRSPDRRQQDGADTVSLSGQFWRADSPLAMWTKISSIYKIYRFVRTSQEIHHASATSPKG
jgi:hypothetical protein